MTRFLMGLGLALMALVVGRDPAAAQSYQIKAGDVLQVEVVEDPSLNRNLLVLPDGRVSMPLAGSVKAAGQTLEQVQSALTSKLAPNFAAPPNVFVTISQLSAPRGSGAPSTIDVYVLGEANKPGKLSVDRGTTVLQLFSQMGGFTPFAATKRIQLRRTSSGTEKIYPLNYQAILGGSSKNGLVGMQDGDVLVIPQRGLFE